jgi:hypothetical protein
MTGVIVNGITYYGDVPMPQVTAAAAKSVWRLIEPYHVKIGLSDGNVYSFWIKAGFEFDGASIPRALWRLCGHPMEAPRIAAALVHDWLYRAQLTDRGTADDIFNALCKEVGMPWWRTGPEWAALRAFGWAAWYGNRKGKKIVEARELGVMELKEAA